MPVNAVSNISMPLMPYGSQTITNLYGQGVAGTILDPRFLQQYAL